MNFFRNLIPARNYSVEPPQAEEMAVNLLKKRKRFAMTQAETPGMMHDVVVITVGGSLVEREETEEYAKSITCETLDDACQFAVNCVRTKMSFAVHAQENPGHHPQWVFTVERNKGIRERHGSRVFG